MATNKRKDAAALFELIDRSTLKVPKNAGALKIPSWWSSKTNPPSNATTSAMTSRPATLSTAAPAAAPPARLVPVADAAGRAAGKDGENVRTQSRLFEPPPANAEPAASPSIRPPNGKAPVPIAPALKVSAPVSSAPATAETLKATEPIDEKDLPPDVPVIDSAEPTTEPRAARVFAPQTHAQDRKSFSPSRPRKLARLPAWVLLTGMAGVVLVVCIIVAVAKKTNSSTPATPGSAVSGRNSGPSATGQGLIPQSGSLTNQAQGGTENSGAHNVAAEDQAPKIYAEGTFPYVPTQFYVIVCSTPSETIAKRNAGWLVDRGISVAVEKIKSHSGNSIVYAVVAVRAFPSKLAAEPFCREIVTIGDSHIRGAWATAYPSNGLSAPASHPAASGRGP